MKKFLQSALRRFHWRFFSRPLPDRLAIYFHALDAHEHEPFAVAIRWIQTQGYSFVSPGEFLTAPGKVCLVSFDDNFKAWHDALPFFNALGLQAAFYTNTCVLRGESSAAEEERYCRVINYQRPFVPLSRQDIQEMHSAGHWFGAHTHSHVALSRVSPQVAEDELKRNRDILEDITGSPVTDMAFPFGLPRFFSPAARDVAVRVGFKTIAWATSGMLHHQGDPLMIHRTQWNYGMSETDNARIMQVDGGLFVRLTGRSPVGV
ncbi:MAG TPA: polysaccharide deacetylase family protein [Verrucomicrobiales bacterium]|nr:polysaccharide deacetylase family protein [Verrucomicrobiales bacterium]